MRSQRRPAIRCVTQRDDELDYEDEPHEGAAARLRLRPTARAATSPGSGRPALQQGERRPPAARSGGGPGAHPPCARSARRPQLPRTRAPGEWPGQCARSPNASRPVRSRESVVCNEFSPTGPEAPDAEAWLCPARGSAPSGWAAPGGGARRGTWLVPHDLEPAALLEEHDEADRCEQVEPEPEDEEHADPPTWSASQPSFWPKNPVRNESGIRSWRRCAVASMMTFRLVSTDGRQVHVHRAG